MSQGAKYVLAFGLGSLTWPLWLAIGEELGRRNGIATGYAFGAK